MRNLHWWFLPRGEFQSVKDAEGQEYLWQGDAATWTDRGPNLFPISVE